MKTQVTVNKKDKLFIIPESRGGFSCLGFDVCFKRANALAVELGLQGALKGTRKGSLRQYKIYQDLINEARTRNLANGWRSRSELTPQLEGKEGCRVEVVTTYGEKRRFIVGKSMGFIPCHLEVARRNSSGGCACESEYKSVHVLYQSR